MSALQDYIKQITDEALRQNIQREVDRLLQNKKFGLVFENHQPEYTPLWGVPIAEQDTVARKAAIGGALYTVVRRSGRKAWCLPQGGGEVECFFLDDIVRIARFGEAIYPCLQRVDAISRAPESALWHTLIEAENFHALQLLEWLYAGKVDCIYIDPPYNTGAKDWKYNNDYVEGSDAWRHSKWLAMMERRLKLAKKLLNPKDSVLIVTIDDNEYARLLCLLEEAFPEAHVQTISTVINPSGKVGYGFSTVHEYIVIIFIGNSHPIALESDMLSDDEDASASPLVWESLLRRGASWNPSTRPNLFYPILIEKSTNKIVGVGSPTPAAKNIPKNIDGYFAAWPIKRDGTFAIWRVEGRKLLELAQKGYAFAASYDEKRDTFSLKYLMKGDIDRIEKGEIVVSRSGRNGEVVALSSHQRKKTPKTIWNKRNHNAGMQGSDLLSHIVGRRGFSYPKSLYAVHDALRFFVANKPGALILDFFAGSGTTLHAVNLLNAADGGQRRCILVTNNEVSAAEEEKLRKDGHKPGDAAWEALGIARHVTWPRTVCSIRGENVHGEPLTGQYLGSGRDMAAGFAANAIYFKLGFLDKTSVALGQQFAALLPLLWMQAGGRGPCPQLERGEADALPPLLLYPQNGFAVLLEEKGLDALCAGVEQQGAAIRDVFIVADCAENFARLAAWFAGKTCHYLYHDYLENFRINAAKGEQA